MKRRVVVTGLGVVTSLSQEVDALWDLVLAGESGIHLLEVVDRSQFKVKFGGDVHDWDPSHYLTEKEAKRVDRFSQFAIAAGSDAVEHAGVDFTTIDPFRTGVIMGSGIGGLNEFESKHTRLVTKGPQRVSPLTIPKLMLNAGIHPPDAIILDLEDSVAPSEKDAARLIVRNALRTLDFFGAERMVRINQGKSGTMVSLVGPGRSYQGFLEKSGPTRVLSYQGLLSPTRVFGRPQADTRVNEMQTIVLKQPEHKIVIITYVYNVNHGNVFHRSNITERQLVKPWEKI